MFFKKILLSVPSPLPTVSGHAASNSFRRSDNFLKSTDIILISTAPTNDDVSIPIDRSAIRNKSLSKYLMSRQTGQKLLITRQLLRSFRSQPVGCDLTFSLLYEYAYKNTSNPFEQDSCKLGSVVLEGD
ncbi:hypothetical protein FXO37_03576 [Capsicum annuum]|nr:hypothetical protein FXO37_03576 [Capsicum annuum]